ncbi:MAG: serine acetyltransferase [Firmicutes bacterium]|nr:serine acetyltransferase [Bacillota bacterium]
MGSIRSSELSALSLSALDELACLRREHANCPPPDRKKVIAVIKLSQALLYPEYFSVGSKTVLELAEDLTRLLKDQIGAALRFNRSKADSKDQEQVSPLTDEQEQVSPLTEGRIARTAELYITSLPGIYSLLEKDVTAMYDGDPAASSTDEIALCYPGFYAISIFRLAHVLYRAGVPLIPRMMTEFAHEKTGIDINPGAEIGDYFCIDHGTGIVIGETAVIGDRVKIYQGVTIGARSFEKDENGNPVKGGKRHPNIGSGVVIYANATILGGDTVIGDGCTIGSSAWITHSVPPGSTVVR